MFNLIHLLIINLIRKKYKNILKNSLLNSGIYLFFKKLPLYSYEYGGIKIVIYKNNYKIKYNNKKRKIHKKII